MALESGTYVNSLNASNPASTDGLGQADDHIRLIKSTLKNTLPNLSGPVSATDVELSTLGGYTGSTADLNILSGAATAGVTSSELQYLNGVTSGIQSQIDTIVAASGAANDSTVTVQAGVLLGGGGSFTTNQSGASTLTIDHDTVSRSNTTTTEAPAAGTTFTAIDQVTSDSYGHITGVRTKTITMPATTAGTTYTAGTGISVSGSVITCTVDTPTEVGLGNLYNNGNSVSGSFTATGNITAYSDERLKSDIEIISGALSKVQAIRGVNFTVTATGDRSTGVIAQEVQAQIPEAVQIDDSGFLSVAYGNLVGLLIESVKELSDEVQALKQTPNPYPGVAVEADITAS